MEYQVPIIAVGKTRGVTVNNVEQRFRDLGPLHAGSPDQSQYRGKKGSSSLALETFACPLAVYFFPSFQNQKKVWLQLQQH